MDKVTEELINDLWATAGIWFDYYWYWLMAGEIIGCIIVVGLIAVASSAPFITRFVEPKNLAFVIAALGAVNTFLDPLGRAEGYGSAMTTLQIALTEAETAPDATQPAFPGWYRILRCNGSDCRIGYNMLSGIERGSHGGPGG